MPKVPAAQKLRIRVSEEAGAVSALWLAPASFRAVAVLAHGAGAGMTHPFMEQLASECAALGAATLRYQFPYMEQGKRLPGARTVLIETVRAAVAEAVGRAAGCPVVAGGKSMGGRMTSLAASEPAGLPGITGLAFIGFPLHAAKKTGTERADHLRDLAAPMLFVQGTRDALAPLDELRPVVRKLGARATLRIVEDGDHSFAVRKRSGRTNDDAMREVATALCDWMGAQQARRKEYERRTEPE